MISCYNAILHRFSTDTILRFDFFIEGELTDAKIHNIMKNFNGFKLVSLNLVGVA
jgi:hypothetical protein